MNIAIINIITPRNIPPPRLANPTIIITGANAAIKKKCSVFYHLYHHLNSLPINSIAMPNANNPQTKIKATKTSIENIIANTPTIIDTTVS
jgi:hypothetical protein